MCIIFSKMSGRGKRERDLSPVCLEEAVANLNRLLGKRQELLASKESEVARLNEEVARLNEELARLNEELARQKADNLLLDIRAVGAEENCTLFIRANDIKRLRNEKLRAVTTGLEAEIQSLKAENERLEAHNAELELRLNSKKMKANAESSSKA